MSTVESWKKYELCVEKYMLLMGEIDTNMRKCYYNYRKRIKEVLF